MALDHLTIETGQDCAGALIWLHGLGADAHDFEPLAHMLPLEHPLRFLFPNAPVRPVTMNAGARMRAWYDVNPDAPLASGAEIPESVALVAELVEAQLASGVPAERIALGGFSQGGVIALELGLSFRKRLAGIMALSTYLHDHGGMAERISLASTKVPIFMAHGLADQVLPFAWAVTARETLRALNCKVEWREYDMGHEVCPEEIAHIADWLNRIFR